MDLKNKICRLEQFHITGLTCYVNNFYVKICTLKSIRHFWLCTDKMHLLI